MTFVKSVEKTKLLNSGVLRVVGRDRFIEFTLDDSLPINTVTNGLRSYLDQFAEKFEGSGVTLNLGARSLNIHELKSIQGLLEAEFSLKLEGIFCSSDTINQLISDKPIIYTKPLEDSKGQPEMASNFTESGLTKKEINQASSSWTDTLTMKGTCRSGTTIHNTGNVLILGDVNPGAEISATKDIIVFGRLGGVAHAGANGQKAMIIALNFEAPQLRIGKYIRMDPPVRKRSRSSWTPEMAFVKDGEIRVEPFIPKSSWK
jgi:septum site-determining protein MinC